MSDRFWRYVAKSDACWQWIGGRTGSGYGRYFVSPDVGQVYAHRFAYEAAKGPIPKGLQIDHLCRNRGCVNPDHLEAVLPAENNRRSASRSAQNVRADHCPQGHPYDVANTYDRPGGGRGCMACRREAVRQYKRRRRAAAREARRPS